MMKKILCLILVLSLMLSLSACSLDKLVTDAIKGILEGAISGGSSGENNYTEPPVLQDVTDVIDLSGAKRVELVYMDAYVITGVTEDAARAYEQTLTAGGYAASGTGWVNDTAEPNFMSYLDGQYPKNAFICFYKDTVVVAQAAYLRHPGDLWLLAGAPAELISEGEISSEEDNLLPDFSGAEQTTIGGYPAKVISGVTWKQIDNYAYWLQCRKNYENAGYFDNPPEENVRYLGCFMTEDDGYAKSVYVGWANDKAFCMEVDSGETVDEYMLWEWLGAPVAPGLAYLEQFLLYIKSNQVGSGNGFESSGHYYSYCVGATAEDFHTYKDKLIGMGFTEEPIEVDNGSYKEYTAARYAVFGPYRYSIWYQLILDGDYLEAEVGFSVNEGTHKED